MHLVVAFAAGAGEAGAQALRGLRLPHLQRLLSMLAAGEPSGSDAFSLNPPHEHVLARARGWPCRDGCLPLAAAQARADGLSPREGEGWGLLTPTHWQVGREQIVLRDPDELALDESESRALLQAVRALFDSEGWALHWGAPLRWYACHASLQTLSTASLDRVIGRAIDPWLPDRLAARHVRRLQSEVQMLLHTHALNGAREARGALPVNSFWLSGTGAAQPAHAVHDEPELDLRLRTPLLAEDWAAWSDAWHTLDTTRMAELHARAQRGADCSLTLCGERRAQRFDAAPGGRFAALVRRWRGAAVQPVLEAL